MRWRLGVAILCVGFFVSNLFGFDRLATSAGAPNRYQKDQQKPEKHPILYPASLDDSIEIFNRIAYEARTKENAIGGIISETAVNYIEQMQTGLNTINISSNITSNTIWTANNEYHITANINVQALLVIEPGTIIYFADTGGLIVNNGGTLISAGTPDNPITYTSEAGNGWYDYYCAIEVQETASPATKITYSYIDCAYIAILTKNIRLDTPIQNNYLFYNSLGVREYGTHHTDVINNLIGYGFNEDYYSFGIEVFMESETETADANSSILIENNTCDYHDYEIVVHGTEEQHNGGLARIFNNIVSNAEEYGLVLADGYFTDDVSNTGYYFNYYNTFGVSDEDNPVESFNDPFDPSGWHLVDGCSFIDAGLEYVEETALIGKTTAVDGTPDSNKIDIGFHYPNWGYSNAGATTLQADFDGNFKVDYNDLAMFADFWLFDYNEAYQVWYWDYDGSGRVDFGDLMVIAEYWLSPFDFIDFADFANQWQREVDERLFDGRADLNKDNIVNFRDFAVLAGEWGKVVEGNPAISVNVSGDANNLKGEVVVNVSGCPYSTLTAFIFMDGQLMGQTDYNAEEGEPGITINTPSYLNGNHLLKAAIMDKDILITLSGNLAVNFNNPAHCLSIEDTYEHNQPLRLLGFSATENNLQVKLSKWDGTTIWSQETSGDLDINIPGDVLAGQIYDVSIEQEIGGGMRLMDSGESWGSIYKRAVNAEYDPNKQYKYAIFLPSAYFTEPLPIFNSADSRKGAVAGIVNGCENMGIEYVILYKDQCTWENFKDILQKPSLIYVYLTSRGDVYTYNYQVNDKIERTHFRLSNNIHILSHFKSGEQWPSNYYPMSYFNFGSGDKFKIVWIDVCFNGRDDMARAWMGFDPASQDKLYLSWNSGIRTSNDECFAMWTAYIWGYPDPNYGFGQSGANSFFDASNEASKYINNQSDTCSGSWIESKLVEYGEDQIRFTPNRYDY